MKKIWQIIPDKPSALLQEMMAASLGEQEMAPLKASDDLTDKTILIGMELDHLGLDLALLSFLKNCQEGAFKGATIGLLMISPSEEYTKSAAQQVIHLCNQLGAQVIGQPLVEVIRGFKNMRKWAEYLDISLKEAMLLQCRRLGERLEQGIQKEKGPLLVLHANQREQQSNTHQLFEMVRKDLKMPLQVFHVEDGTIMDCNGCAVDTCLYYGESQSCFYGGMMVKEILPAIQEAAGVLWLTPNYNDAMSAKLMAVVNRLTVLYRKGPFYHKALHGIIVSGNSGSDTVAKQLIGSLCLNKGFYLPPNFYLQAIASSPREILEVAHIEQKAKDFAMDLNAWYDLM